MGPLLYFEKNAKSNVNPGHTYLERCSLACEHLLANLHFWGTNITMLNLFLVLFLEWSIVMAPLQTQSIIYYIIVARFLALVTTMVTKVDHGN